jgi:hypothetical protein
VALFGNFRTIENADIFVERLVREGLLLRDPVVEAALQGQLTDLTQRAVQYRFVQATGITQSTARQIERARSATLLLQQGVSILDTIQQAGYYDQPHLTRAAFVFVQDNALSLRHTTLTCVHLDMKRLLSCQLSVEQFLFHCFQKADQTRGEEIPHPQKNQQNFNRFMSKCTLIETREGKPL